MMRHIEKALDFVLSCMLPLPYCEVDGHKFWRKKSYESWLEIQEINRMRNEGKLHRISYRHGYKYDAESLRDGLLEHLDKHDGKIFKVIGAHFEPADSTYDVMYLCDVAYKPRLCISEKYLVSMW